MRDSLVTGLTLIIGSSSAISILRKIDKRAQLLQSIICSAVSWSSQSIRAFSQIVFGRIREMKEDGFEVELLERELIEIFGNLEAAYLDMSDRAE